MPGKVSTRSSTALGISQKSSTQTKNSRQSIASRISSPAVVIPNEGPSTTLRVRICNAFRDAQKTTAGHRKLTIVLRKLQEACCYDSLNDQSGEGFTEDDFNVEIARCAIRIMGVKKSEGAGDRLIRFLGLFLRHASEQDIRLLPESEVEQTQIFPETPATRLTSYILSILLPLLTSKEKTVRYRSTQLLSHIINSLDSIDDDYFQLLKTGLLKRVRDKEPTIRIQAVLGLGRLAGNEDDVNQDGVGSDDDDAGSRLLEKLLEILQNDPSADVRRSLLLNLPLTPGTLPYLLERARDLDPPTRRALYSRLLPALGDFRHLSLTMREKLLRWGLRDRDENVRKSAARLFSERWIEDCIGQKATDGGAAATVPVDIDGLLELLERIDVVNSGVEGGVALEAMKEFWASRPDYQEVVTFSDSFWNGLTPESVFMARSLNEFCRYEGNGQFETLVEEKMPEVTKLAFFLQQYLNSLVSSLLQNTERSNGEEEGTDEKEFIVEQLLHIAKTLDYSDEVGRRKMFALLRETLAIPNLPDEITRLVVDVLRDVCGLEVSGEREFCGIVLEAVAEIHDTISVDEPPLENEEESFHSALSEVSENLSARDTKKQMAIETDKSSTEDDNAKAIREIMVNMKCLHVAQCMLQNVEGNLQENLHLVTTLNNLVVPAVRSHEAPIRERGLFCLGLCCLLDQNLAQENITLFLHCYNKGHDALQVTALHVLSDMLITYPNLLSLPDADSAPQKSLLKVLSKSLKAVNAPEVQAAGTIAFCKLMLTNIVQDEELLKQAVISYVDPATKENAAVRQALSYFLPVYCHSRKENMERMATVAPSILHTVLSLTEEMDEEEEMVGTGTVGNMLVDWTDPRKLVIQDEDAVSWDEAGKREIKTVHGDIHLNLAESLLEKVMSHSCTREEKEVIIPLFSKLYITSNSAQDKLQTVYELATEAIDLKVANDTASRNALNKFHAALTKAVGEAQTIRNVGEETVVDKIPDKLVMRDKRADQADVKTELAEAGNVTEVQDSLLEELLDDDKEELRSWIRLS